MKRGISAGLLTCALLVVWGCGPGGPPTVPVKGKITKGGAGVPNVTITLIDVSRPNDTAAGTSDASGNFTLTYGSTGKPGAVPGKYKVVLSGGAAAPTVGTPENKGGSYGGGKQGAPVAAAPYDTTWASHETSPLEVEVKSEMPDLEVKLD